MAAPRRGERRVATDTGSRFPPPGSRRGGAAAAHRLRGHLSPPQARGHGGSGAGSEGELGLGAELSPTAISRQAEVNSGSCGVRDSVSRGLALVRAEERLYPQGMALLRRS